MSDIKTYNYSKKKILKFQNPSLSKLKEIVKENGKELLGLMPIAFDAVICSEENLKADTLAIDENYYLTVIEYRLGRFSQTINKGLLIIDYIIHNKGKIKLLLNELIGTEKASEVNLDARLVSLSDDFNKFDEFGVKQMNPEIDLIKFSFFDKDILMFEKVYQGKKVIMDDFPVSDLNSIDKSLYKEITEFILSLGDEVVQRGFDSYIAFRKIKYFAYLFFQDGIIMQIKLKDKFKEYKIKTSNDFQKITSILEESYEQC